MRLNFLLSHFFIVYFYLLSQRFYRSTSVGSLKNSTSRNENVCTCRNCKLRGLCVNSSVNLNVYIESAALDFCTKGSYLLKHIRHKGLTAKSGLDCHYEYHIASVKIWVYCFDGSFGLYRYCGALAVLIDGLRAKYPDSLILFSTSWYVNDDMKAYTDATLAVCEAKGIPCYNAADPSRSGVMMYQPSFRSQYCVKPNDVSHLNAAGMNLVLPKFEAFIAEEAAKYFK